MSDATSGATTGHDITAAAAPPVAVGFDGTERSRAALRYAVAEAASRNAPLVVIHVSPRYAAGLIDRHLFDDEIDRARRSVQETVADEVRRQAPGLAVDVRLVDGPPVERIVEQAKDAQLVVLGRETKPPVERLVMGAMTNAVASRTSAPTVVVGADAAAADETPGRTRGWILVGFKEPGHAEALLDAAFEHAIRTNTAIRVLHAADDAVPDTAAERVTRAAVAPWREAYPEVRLTIEIVREDPGDALVRASGEADLLLVLRRSRRFPGLHLGRVARAVADGASCPVELVPAADTVALLEVEHAGSMLR